MSLDLPKAIADYIVAENGGDTETLARYFAPDAIVRDEGGTHHGLAAIRAWMAETKRKYRHTMEPVALVRSGETTIVTNRLTGQFPGSPIELKFVFRLDGGKIASLEIGT